ncbi:MAG: hypothetical protein ACRDI2_05860, partial [Chloroflexota bacterium]
QVVMSFQDYEDAVHWLNEDEYDLVEGRWSAEGGAATDQEPNAVPERASPTDMEQRRLAVSSRAERG